MTDSEILQIAESAGIKTRTGQGAIKFGRAIYAQAMEEAARICEGRHRPWKWDDDPDSDSGPRDCARSIRAALSAGETKGGQL